MLGFNGKLLDFIYPVGSYYETSDTSFNPNTSWGGTWIEDSKGRVTVALDSNDIDFDTINKTGGEKEHTLTVDEIPSHNHELYGALTGETKAITNTGNDWAQTTTNYSVDTYIKNTGGGQPHNNIQPYIVVKRWHRTA